MAKTKLQESLELLQIAITYLEDGAIDTALERTKEAVVLLEYICKRDRSEETVNG